VKDRIAALLAADRLRPVFLFDQCDTLRVDVEELRPFDLGLDTLANLNHPADYEAALAKAGFGPAPVTE
jgi:molybdopterin-guanine dinucleotide biosynthesis protein A